MKLFKIACLSILLSFNVHALADTLKLNGISEFNRLRTTFYIAALYLENPSNNLQTIQQSSDAGRMEIRIVADKWRSRSFSSYLLGQVAINNDEANITAFLGEGKPITKLSQLAKDSPLIAGDTIIIEFNGSQTQIAFNGQVIAKTNGKDLFNVLVNIWTGKRAPSRQFKEDILNLPSEDLIADTLELFLILKPSPEKVSFAKRLAIKSSKRLLTTEHSALIASGKAQVAKETQAAQKAKAAEAIAQKEADDADLAAKKAEVANLAAQQDAAAQAQALKAAEAAAAQAKAQERQAALAKIKKQKVTAEKAKQEAARIAKEKAAAERKRKEKEAMLAKQRKEAAAKAKALAEAEERSKAANQAQLLAKTKAIYDYKADLRTQVYKYVEYPARAFDLGQEGNVVISIEVDAKGKIQSADVHTSSNYRSLDKAAVKAAKRIKSQSFSKEMGTENIKTLLRVAFRK